MRSYFHGLLKLRRSPDGDSFTASAKLFDSFVKSATAAGWNCADHLLGPKEWRVTPQSSSSGSKKAKAP
jgi:hypothetical protein